MDETTAKKVCARVACETEIAVGSRKTTVKPPRSPWVITVPSAMIPRTFNQRRSSSFHNQIARTIVNIPTNDAIIRWPCSYRMPPTIGGMIMPYARGQSGTARLEPVLVTNPPAMMRKKVHNAVKTENRCKLLLYFRVCFSLKLLHRLDR